MQWLRLTERGLRLCQITLALCGERSESATSNLLNRRNNKERTNGN